jgi:guanylate kinase
MGKLIILAGPSCVGKSPLDKALARFYPEMREHLQHLVLYNSRSPRPGEKDGIDYHFRDRSQIEALDQSDRYVVMDVRGDLQALDIEELKSQLGRGDVFFEGNPFVGRILQTHENLKDIERLSFFMSPLSKDEIAALVSPDANANLEKILTDIMRRKLLRRTRKQKGELSLKDLENIERRASSALTELKNAHHFEHIIPNHDGEDSENWDAFYYPVGDARKALLAFVALMKGHKSNHVEKWNADLIP